MTRRLKNCKRSTAWRCVCGRVVGVGVHVRVYMWVGGRGVGVGVHVRVYMWVGGRGVGVGVTSGLYWLPQLKDAVMKLQDDQSMEIEMLKRAYSVALQGEQPPSLPILPDGMIIDATCHSSL